MAAWLTVAPGVHQRRYEPFDISIVVIEGDDGLLLVDTRAQPSEAVELAADIAAGFDRPVRWVVNTHAHFDHTFGNQVFGPGTATDAAIFGHSGVAAHFADFEGPRLAAWRADPTREPDRRWADVVLTPPTHPLDRALTLDLGGRLVELRPQAPAHTDTDLVLFLPDARVWILGDLIEESGPVMYGSGSYPLGWPGVLDALAAEMQARDLVVPGHGRVVDRAFVERQARELRLIAERFRAAHDAGLTVAEALAAHASWPIPVDGLVGAVERAYLALDAPRETLS
ncbi:MBL fold metallo-hydrolase [Agromyces badenianii]|uniref:MBL fold metallo-hydrolase n=1 Tax=Agromyces badenianii TaxID=2080742 RepID=A0A2S0WVF1_9MICO|nr:MBL fold metallo-hydrolase [Agromyces badenianii]AWB95302.1 MBL fold metallo-hydrolase [Agromyces badenianii]